MKKVIEQFFCDLCDKQVALSKDLVQLKLAGYGVATSEKEICWACVQSFANWKQSRIGKAGNQ